MIDIRHGDCLDVLPTLAENSVDAVVTDPPYHLTTGKKGGTGPASLNVNSPAGRSRIGTDFMGMKWDGGDVAMRPETWVEVLRVAKPGAYLLAFGGTRTHHRIMCAIEDAGFEIRDTAGWMYGSGFPKSANGEWGGTALKPAWEPIIVARKPLQGTLAQNFTKWGTGGLDIDKCRITLNGDYKCGANGRPSQTGLDDRYDPGAANQHSDVGRWPANLLHDGSDEVIALFPESDGQQGDVRGTEPSVPAKNVYGTYKRSVAPNLRGDVGSAARFFYCAKADRADRNEGCDDISAKPLNWSSGEQSPGTFQSPNTDRSARNHHPTVKPTDLMRYLCRLVTPKGGTVLDPFMGSGSTLKAAELEGFSAIGIEREAEYVEIARRRIAADMPLFRESA